MGIDLGKYTKRSFKDALSRASDDFSNKLQDKATNALSGALGKGLRSLGLSSSVVSDITSRFADSVKADLAAEWYGRSQPETNRISGEGIRNLRKPEGVAQVNASFQSDIQLKQLNGITVFPKSGLGKYKCSLVFRDYERPKPTEPATSTIADTIFLPLPRNLVEMYGIELQKQGLGTIGAAFDEYLTTGNIRAVADDIKIAAYDQFSRAMGDLLNSVVDNAGTAALAALQQSNQFAFNPHLSVMFQGVQLRPHSFRWLMAAETPEDSAEIKKIISKIRQYALPNFFADTTAMFTYPKMVTVNFYPWADDPKTRNDFYPIKQCLIEGISVNYAPNGIPSFFRDGSPTMVELEVRLYELEYFTEFDFTGKRSERVAAEEGKDLLAKVKGGKSAESGSEPTSTNSQQPPPKPAPPAPAPPPPAPPGAASQARVPSWKEDPAFPS